MAAGYIYLMYADTGHYKIGRSINPNERLRQFSTEMPVEVSTVHTFKTDDMVVAERVLHEQLREFRYRGEWFVLNEQFVEWFKTIYRLDTKRGVLEFKATTDSKDDSKRLVQILENDAYLAKVSIQSRYGERIIDTFSLKRLFYVTLQLELDEAYEPDPENLEADFNYSELMERFDIALEKAVEDDLLWEDTYISIGSKRPAEEIIEE